MRQDLAQLVTCDHVATLPGCDKSQGAQLEVYIADRLGHSRQPGAHHYRIPSATMLKPVSLRLASNKVTKFLTGDRYGMFEQFQRYIPLEQGYFKPQSFVISENLKDDVLPPQALERKTVMPGDNAGCSTKPVLNSENDHLKTPYFSRVNDTRIFFSPHICCSGKDEVMPEENKLHPDLARIYGIFGLHHSHSVGVLLVNIQNTKHFADLLHAVEREFFMVPGKPSGEPEDEGAPVDDECLVNCWGSTWATCR
ncbi:hypothetical protein PSCICN_38340 [Pseudomonas cichorii]|nr:hypothetical protein PSCICN_38340 [Pseudomonas cichorii]